MRYSQILALLACAVVGTSGIATKTLPDGQVVRIPASKPLPSHPHAGNLKFGRDRAPKPKPKPFGQPGSPAPPTSTPGASVPSLWNKQGGLDRPSAEGFKKEKGDIVAWFKKEYNAFLTLPKDSYPNFVLYLQQKWAPKALSSGTFCDSVGSCDIASCLNLVDEGIVVEDGKVASHHDRQMALYVFEWLANTDHVFAVIEKKLQETLQGIINNSDRLVDEFSSAQRIQDAAQKEYKERTPGLQIGTFLGLVAGGVAGVAAVGGGPAAGAAAAINLIVGLFFSMLFLFGA
jgi:hypothetical protein